MIEVLEVSKTFGVRVSRPGWRHQLADLFNPRQRQVVAVHDLTFTLQRGDFVGYLGRNGAGKSTTIKMLCGVIVPNTGTIRVAGVEPYRHRLRNAMNIGVVFGQRTQLWWDLPLIDSLQLHRRMYRIPDQRCQQSLALLTELLGLGPLLATPVRQLSLGQRIRGDLAAALLHEPSVLFLDEPTIGLDVLGKERLRQFLRRINAERRTTIVLTTHDLADVEQLCRRILLIEAGTLIYDGSVEDLRRKHAPYRILVVTLESSEAVEIPGAVLTRHEGHRSWLQVDPAQTPIASLIAEIGRRYPVHDLTVQEPELEAVVRGLFATRDSNYKPPTDPDAPGSRIG